MKKFLAMSLSIAMVLAIFVGTASASTTKATTSSKATSSSSNPWAKLNTKKAVTITIAVVGVIPTSFKSITAKVNTRMKKMINTTVNWDYIPWSDFQTKYSLLVASGSIDLIYAANWCNFKDYVNQGAFLPFSQSFIKTYMPVTYKTQAKASWQEVTFNGKIYGVTKNQAAQVSPTGVIVRSDLMKEVGISSLSTLKDYENFLTTFAKKEKGTGVYALYPQSAWPMDGTFYNQANDYVETDAGNADDMVWSTDNKTFNVKDMIWEWDNPQYEAFALKMAEFNADGVWPSNIMSNNTHIFDMMLDGKNASDPETVINAATLIPQLKAKGFSSTFYNCLIGNGKMLPGTYLQYAYEIPSVCKNVNRAAICLDFIKNDKTSNLLLEGGVAGTNYIDNKDGTYSLGPKAADYTFNSWGYFFDNTWTPSLKLPEPYQSIQTKAVKKSSLGVGVFKPQLFKYNSSKYATQLTNISAIMSQYRFSFCFGVFGSQTAAQYKIYQNELLAAGEKEVVADIKSQLASYCASK